MTICKWVKASERLPGKTNELYIIRNDYRKEVQYATLFVIKHKVGLKLPIEWLDEQYSAEPNQESHWEEIYQRMRDYGFFTVEFKQQFNISKK